MSQACARLGKTCGLVRRLASHLDRLERVLRENAALKARAEQLGDAANAVLAAPAAPGGAGDHADAETAAWFAQARDDLAEILLYLEAEEGPGEQFP